MGKTFFAQKTILFDKTQNKILLLQRSTYKKYGSGLWDFIGGSVEFAENNKEALIREAREEVGVKLNKPQIIDLYSGKGDQEDSQFIFALYFCDEFEYIKKNIQLSDEHQVYKWIEPKEIKDYELNPSLRPLIEKIMEI